MLENANDFDNGTVLETDLCIVGAGAAGITLGLQFVDSRTSVVILEGGGLRPSAASQNLYAGTCDPPLATTYPIASRLRFLGGTTNHWLGYWDPPLYEGSTTGLAHSQKGQTLLFGEEYREPLTAAPNLRLLLHANVIRVGLRDNAGSAEQLDVATLGGKRFSVRAECFVLALGGIENSRMLLVSDDVQAGGVGNGHDLVGRYWMDHSGFPLAEVCVSDRDRTLIEHRPLGGRIFRLNEETQRRHRLCNCGLMFDGVPEMDDTRHLLLRDGAWERLAPYLEDSGALSESSVLGRLTKHAAGEEKLYHRRFSLLPEQPPTPNSRVTLGSEEDPFGNRRVHLSWSLPPEMYRTARRTAELFAEDLGRRGLGRVAIDLEALEGAVFPPGYHHMGGTRMHGDPRQGVVDSQCRVHGVANLYIAGSSVFPTSGWANPTFTIVALALRLADHLASRLGGGA
jgi:choline dehydrogenase-like flavoprotein